jgi:hypothetical protein
MSRMSFVAGLAAVLTSAFVAGHAADAHADTLAPPVMPTETIVIPEIVELPGSPNIHNNGLDTTIKLVLGTDYRELTPGLSAASLSRSQDFVHIYLFEKQTDEMERLLLNDDGKPVCNPCTIELGGRSPLKETVRVERLIYGGNNGSWLANTPVFRGYAVLKATKNLHDVAVQADTAKRVENTQEVQTYQLAVERLP